MINHKVYNRHLIATEINDLVMRHYPQAVKRKEFEMAVDFLTFLVSEYLQESNDQPSHLRDDSVINHLVHLNRIYRYSYTKKDYQGLNTSNTEEYSRISKILALGREELSYSVKLLNLHKAR